MSTGHRPAVAYRLAAAAMAVRVAHETVVWLSDTGALHLLDPIATQAVSRLDGRTPSSAVAAALAAEFRAPLQQVADDVERLMTSLLDLGVLEAAPVDA